MKLELILLAGLILHKTSGHVLVQRQANTASYLPVGPQTNVSLTSVEEGGWVKCHNETMSNPFSNETIDLIKGKCTGDKVLMSCRPKQRNIPRIPGFIDLEPMELNPEVLTVLAWGDQEIVFGLEEKTVAQGTQFERTPQGEHPWPLNFGRWGFSSAANPEDRAMMMILPIAGYAGAGFYCGEAGNPVPPHHKFWEAVFYHSS